jgi:hypothetical protein
VKIFNSTQTFKNVFVLKFELILIIGSNNVLTEGARKAYRVGQGCNIASNNIIVNNELEGNQRVLI